MSSSSAPATRRLLKELRDIRSDPSGLPTGLIDLGPKDPDGGNLTEWKAVIAGVEGTGYEGGLFELTITIPSSYPIQPPAIKFLTKICHPNVHFKTGEICLDVLKSQWSPAWTLTSACLAVHSLMESPEASSPLNVDAANLLRCGDRTAYNSLLRFYTSMYAMPGK